MGVYRSGYVKQLFTTHAKKRDYMMSKSVTCAFGMACMCLAGGLVFAAGIGVVSSLILKITSLVSWFTAPFSFFGKRRFFRF